MCYCTPGIRTPFCGRIGCNPPKEKALGKVKHENKVVPLLTPGAMTIDNLLLRSIEGRLEGEWFFLSARVMHQNGLVHVDGLELTETPKSGE